MSEIPVDSIYTVDVTDNAEHVDTAQKMVAASYTGFASQPLSEEEVRLELCNDHYQQKKAVRIMMSFGKITENSDKFIPLGTTRIVLGSVASHEKDIQPLEAMELIEPVEGWGKFRFMEFSAISACEFGRYAISPDIRGQHAIAGAVCHQLFRKGIEVSSTYYGASQFWAIMPQYFIRMLDAIGIHTVRAPEIHLNTAKHAAYFAKYDKYWYHSKPWFYRILD